MMLQECNLLSDTKNDSEIKSDFALEDKLFPKSNSLESRPGDPKDYPP